MSLQHEAFVETNVLKERAAARYIGVSPSGLHSDRPQHWHRRAELDHFLDDSTLGPETEQSESTVGPDVEQNPAPEPELHPDEDDQQEHKARRRKKGKAE